MMLMLKIKDSNKYVAAAQYLSGYQQTYGKASNVFDEKFYDFIKKFQKDNLIPVTGEIDEKTWACFAKKAETCSTVKGKKTTIFSLQVLLGIGADGVFGKNTKSAVISYQASAGLATDGVFGPKSWSKLLGTVEKAPAQAINVTNFIQPKDYKQNDSRWGKKSYTSTGNKKQTISNSGCGPTSMADIVATMKDSRVTPPDLCSLALRWGCRTTNSGTAWGFFKKIAEYYGFSKFVQTSSLENLQNCLKSGGYAVCSMGPGYWTKGGHFICAWKCDDNYIYCNDPASSVRKKQKISDFMKQRKQFFCFWK